MRTVLLAGATGLVGRQCLDILLPDPAFLEIKVLTRRPLYLQDPKLREFIIDFDQMEKTAPDLKADIVICCLGSTIKDAGSREQFMKIDRTYPVMLAKLAHRNGTRHFMVVSAVGSNKNSLFFYSRVKGLMEEDVKAIPFEIISIFQPSLIDGERKEVRVMEELSLRVGRPMARFMQGSLKKYRPIPAADIARSICHIAKASWPGIHYYQTPDMLDHSTRYSV